MSSFFNQLSQIETSPEQNNNPHAVPTPVDVSAAARLLQDQYTTLLQTAPNPANEEFLTALVQDLEQFNDAPPTKVAGVPQSYLDSLDRVPKKQLKDTDSCPICGEAFLDDEFPLVVELPCHPTHRFDLDCVGPWLRLNGTCPMDRKDLMKKKEVEKPKNDYGEDEEEYDSMYA
jgi:hypothetical protein